MQMTEKEKMLLGMMTSILMLRKQGHPAYHVEVNESMLDALRVLVRMKNPETRLAGFIYGDEIIDLLNEAFPDPPKMTACPPRRNRFIPEDVIDTLKADGLI